MHDGPSRYREEVEVVGGGWRKGPEAAGPVAPACGTARHRPFQAGCVASAACPDGAGAPLGRLAAESTADYTAEAAAAEAAAVAASQSSPGSSTLLQLLPPCPPLRPPPPRPHTPPPPSSMYASLDQFKCLNAAEVGSWGVGEQH